MRDLDKALADILAIRSHIAAGTAFRSYGPAAVAATGGLAVLEPVVRDAADAAGETSRATQLSMLSDAVIFLPTRFVVQSFLQYKPHVGIIMDGNGRRAAARWRPRGRHRGCPAHSQRRAGPGVGAPEPLRLFKRQLAPSESRGGGADGAAPSARRDRSAGRQRMWPDFGAQDLAEALACFRCRERRFGGLAASAFA